ncbi:aminotransferase class I/II-fold pyridoxal phosphate-dependent enzyme [Bifidobacterium sp. SMA15]|uniref:cysteine-S-conjugate beta-lyase n=2 Tax=Bifidobacterium platyrrhinorum TaxID=2661628 RepID=A0A6L9SR17_9BIFI|nr:aminotransferase class I/II-fold pyridoxal phosphate-dependent enzyme [Bifidobacterium platyrrhinorum]
MNGTGTQAPAIIGTLAPAASDLGTDTEPCFDAARIDAESIGELERIGSDKWTRHPGCIGAFIAEMDYGLAPCVAEAIGQAVARGALGYIPDPWKREVARSCAAWQLRYGWNVNPACIRPVPDVLEAFEVFLREIVRPGNGIVVPTPAYMPFLSVPRLYGVDVIEVPMLRDDAADGGWAFDFDAIERAFAAGCRAFVLCNPHNPIGKVLTRDEMLRLSDLAARHDVRVFSDEIHAPFVYRGRTHVPFASIDERTAMQAFTSTSASKSFNIPGTKCAQVILTNPDDLAMWMRDAEWSEHQTATIGAIATTAAYDHGGAWFDGVLAYIERNIALVNERMRTDLAKVGYVEPQGTYIAWLDFSPLGLDDPAGYFLEKARVALTDGRECGRVGAGCVRMNFAMPYPLLAECLDRMTAALRADGLI